MAVYIAKSINTEHKDLIHDVAFDFYGRRMATCSSDQSVKIWDLNENEEWTCTNVLQTHTGSVWKVTWAHPEFGSIIATCSFDRTAIVWEENVGDYSHGIQSTWFKRTSLVDSRSSVTDVKFAPKTQGLQLAVCSSDGTIRIYEATDVMNLCYWTLAHEIPTKLMSCSCLSWNPSPSRLHPPLIAIGSDDSNPTSGGKVLILEFSENSRKWNKVETLVTVTEAVNDLSFSPNLGRSYHLLAIATKDVRIFSFKPLVKSDPNPSMLSNFEVRLAAHFDDHGSTVWRVSWNMLGTILASSGDDGCVRLWKANYLDVWKCISVLKGDDVTPTPNLPNTTIDKSNKPESTVSTKNTRYLKLATTSRPDDFPWH